MTYYKQAQQWFLDGCGELTAEEEARALEAFDDTLMAAQARFADTWHELWVSIFDAMPFLRRFS